MLSTVLWMLTLLQSSVPSAAPTISQKIKMLDSEDWEVGQQALSQLNWNEVVNSTGLQGALVRALRRDGYGSDSAERFQEDTDHQAFDSQLLELNQGEASELGI